MEERSIPSPVEQLEALSNDMERDWARLSGYMLQATEELLPNLSEEELRLLVEDFWMVHALIMRQHEAKEPDILQRVYARAEQLQQRAHKERLQSRGERMARKVLRTIFRIH